MLSIGDSIALSSIAFALTALILGMSVILSRHKQFSQKLSIEFEMIKSQGQIPQSDPYKVGFHSK